MYLETGIWWRIARSILAEPPAPRRLATQLSLFATMTGLGLSNGACMWLDERLLPGVQRTPVADPLFIVGNARSGTTLFHRLLCADTQRFMHFRTWEILLPAALQKRAVDRLVGLGQRSARRLLDRLRTLEREQMREVRDLHPIGLDQPEEDEFLFMPAFASPALCVLFPYLDRLGDLAHFDSRPARERMASMRFYIECIRRQAYVRGGERMLLSKNPAFVSKMRTLAKVFPRARFVYLVRDPAEALPSLLQMLATIWRQMGFDPERVDAGVAELIEGGIRNYHYALEVLGELSPARYAVVCYPDLIADPTAAVANVYRHFGFELAPDFRDRLTQASQRAGGHRTGHRYRLEDFGLDRERLRDELADIYEMLAASTVGNRAT